MHGLPRSPILSLPGAAVIAGPREVTETLLRAMPAGDRARLEDQVRRARVFAPADRHADPGEAAIMVAVGQIAGTRVAASAMRRGMAMRIYEPGAPTLTLARRRSGGVSLAGFGQTHDGVWGGEFGVLYQERQGALVTVSDDHAGVSFEIPRQRLVAALEALTERPVNGDLGFGPAFSRVSGPGAALDRAIGFVEQELALSGPGGMAPMTAVALEDLLIGSVLALRHGGSAQLERPAAAGGLSNVRRAEDFMRLHATDPLTLDQVATASGCGPRALQAAFQRARGCSPLAVLRRIRLELAHADMIAGARTVMEVAYHYGFSNPGRFAAQYHAAFGVLPSVALRGAGRVRGK